MKDLTLLYYTANVIERGFAERVRELLATHDYPIVSVSHKSIPGFGYNLCIGEQPVSPYTLYKQVLLGAHAATTKYVACCEDDTLYLSEHFAMLPARDDTFYYNTSRWWVESNGTFRFRDRASMCACLVSRELLIETLEARFAKFPDPLPGREAWRLFGEPGRVEQRLGLPLVRMERPKTIAPGVLTFNHRDSLGGKRKAEPQDVIVNELPVWGSAAVVWGEVYGC